MSAISGFFKWLIKHGKAEFNPFSAINSVKNVPRCPRRALKDDELARLYAVSEIRSPLYMTAANSGLRRGELAQLIWGDMHLEGDKPVISVRASTTINGKDANQPIPKELAEILSSMREDWEKDSNLVFFGERFSTYRQRIKDFKTAKIPEYDHLGRKAVFHSLRHTYITRLLLSGVPGRFVQELMRQSDPRLSNKTYLDETALPLRDADSKLEWIEPNSKAGEEEKSDKEKCPLIGPFVKVRSCPHLAQIVQVWDSLDEASRKAIAQLAKASSGKGEAE